MIKRKYFISVQAEVANEIRKGWFIATHITIFPNPDLVMADLIKRARADFGCSDDVYIQVLAFNKVI